MEQHFPDRAVPIMAADAELEQVGPGELESAVLHCLWSAQESLTPRMVLERLDRDLAYTTVMTILTRLFAKQLVTRTKVGRAYAYEPAIDEADFHADRMRAPLQDTGDAGLALLRFVDRLSAKERRALEKALSEWKKV